MWRHVVAIASVLLVGAAVPAAPAQAAQPGPTPTSTRVAAARQAAESDDRLVVAAQRASADTAARRLVDQVAAERTAAERQADRHVATAQRADAERAAAAERRAEAERQAEARRAAEAEAQRQAEAARQAQAQRARKTAAQQPAAQPAAQPAPQQPAAPPAAPAVAWSTSVVNAGDQGAIDACAGGLTRWYEDVDGKPYYPIHRGCGGTPILGLHLGDLVRIDGATWVVTDSRDVPKGSSYAAAAGLAGQILLQTCYRNDTVMRLVALTAA